MLGDIFQSHAFQGLLGRDPCIWIPAPQGVVATLHLFKRFRFQDRSLPDTALDGVVEERFGQGIVLTCHAFAGLIGSFGVPESLCEAKKIINSDFDTASRREQASQVWWSDDIG